MTTPADITLAQLGGNRFKLMTGARDLFSSDGGRTLQFKLPRCANKANLVTITLEDSDEYTVKFMKYRNLDVKTISEHERVQAGNLRTVFESQTGLYLNI
jgi:hypothetical protein